MSQTGRVVGLIRPLAVYHAIPLRQRRVRRLWFEHVSTLDLTPHLDIGRPRDRLVATFIALFGWLPLDGTRFGHVGGKALQTCLARSWIGYVLALLRRRSEAWL